jgi:hypothetical protein
MRRGDFGRLRSFLMCYQVQSMKAIYCAQGVVILRQDLHVWFPCLWHRIVSD